MVSGHFFRFDTFRTTVSFRISTFVTVNFPGYSQDLKMHSQSSDDRKLGIASGVKDVASTAQALPSNASASRAVVSQQKSLPDSQHAVLLSSGSVPLGTSLRLLFIYMQIQLGISTFAHKHYCASLHRHCINVEGIISHDSTFELFFA